MTCIGKTIDILYMRFFTPFLLLLAVPFFSLAQFADNSPIPYFRYAVTGGVGANQLYGDLDKKGIGPTLFLRGNYFLMHGLSVGLEIQEGFLWADDEAAVGGVTRRTRNLYHAAMLDVRFQPLKYMQDDHVRRTEYRQSYGNRVLNSVYAGVGGGVIYNLQWNRNRVIDPATGEPTAEHQGKDRGLGYFLTTNLGFELPLHSLKPNLLDSYIWSVVVNGQANFAFDDEVDGYSGTYQGNTSKDVFGVVSVGVNLRF